MKKNIFLLLVSFVFLQLSHAQNMGVGTTSPQAKFHIKGTADISQLIIDANSVQSNQHPLIRLRSAAGLDLIHLHSDNPENTFVGLNTGKTNSAVAGGLFNTFIGALAGSSNISGYSLTGVGRGALFSNTTGNENTAIGPAALYYNTSGSQNTAIGRGALYQNTTTPDNTATGFKSLFSNYGGYRNTANGSQALVTNIDGSDNTATGFKSLVSNVGGSYNTALGSQALQFNTSGYGNTGIGSGALYANQVGDFNTAIGCDAGAYPGTTNTTAIGYNAYANTSNKVRLGNVSVTVIEGQVAYSFPSDARFKYNIRKNVPGLDFIKKLTPVTYYFDAQKLDEYSKTGVLNNSPAVPVSNSSNQLHSGFLAQDVERISNQLGYDFDGVHAPANATDHYSLAYSQFVVPLVKAVQEQQAIIETLKAQMAVMKKEIRSLKKKS